MKKILISIFTFFSVIFCAEMVYASTSISVKAPSSVTIGDNINVTVTLSSSEAIGSWNFVVGYDTSKLTLLNNTNQRVVGYGDGNAKSKSYTFTFKSKATGSAKVYIDSASYYSFNEVNENVSKGSATVNIKEKSVPVPVTYSKNNNLSKLEIEGFELKPEFNKDTLEYEVTLPEETYNIKLNATPEDNKAKISGIGDLVLIDGENKLEVKVTAENGNVKTYVIKANVLEPNPVTVKVNDKEYTVVRKKDGLTVPANYKQSTINLSGEEVLAFHNEITGFYLVALKSEDGNIEFYKYDTNDESLILYNELSFNSISIYPYDIPDNKKLEGYEIGSITINGIEVQTLKNNKNYPILYGMNLTDGTMNLYTYDASENTLQKYNKAQTEKLEKENQKYFYIIIGLGSVCILQLVIMVIILSVKNNKNNKKIEEKLDKTIKFSTVKDNEDKKSKKQLKKIEKAKKEKNKDDEMEIF